MSLFTSLQVAKNSLLVSQLGLQVTGNNISNAHTPGYIRQELIQSPAATARRGNLLLGLGVQVDKIQQQVDKFLEERLRAGNSDLASSETQEKVYLQLEAMIGELTDSDISTALTNFFNAITEVLNQPESRSIRNLVVLQGDVLTTTINRLDDRLNTLHGQLNDRVVAIADEINSILEDVARLNIQITSAEGGSAKRSDAVGLRDKRQLLLTNLSKLTEIQVSEQPSGAVTVFSGGEYLVFDGQFRNVDSDPVLRDGFTVQEIRVVETDVVLTSSSGELAGLASARDEIIAGFLGQLDFFTQTMAYEFNKVYSGGQGLVGYSTLTSEFAVESTGEALDQTGLPFTPVSGTFQVLVRNKQTGLTATTDVYVNLHGLDTDTSLQDLADALGDIDGLTAEITATRQLQLNAESSNFEFSFANDTTGTLASLGLNTFFSGDSAGTLSVNNTVSSNPAMFAASRTGIAEDTENAVTLAGLLDAPLESQNGASLIELYSRTAVETSQAAATARSVAEGFRIYQKTLQGEQLSVSGVSIDEEAIRMITYQRVFQMSARFISSVSDLLDLLVNL